MTTLAYVWTMLFWLGVLVLLGWQARLYLLERKQLKELKKGKRWKIPPKVEKL